MLVKPISPQEISSAKLNIIPDEIINCWNNEIAKNYTDRGNARIDQSDIVDKIADLMCVSRSHVFSSGWLEIEDIYREQGWKVIYHKSDYTENGASYFEFKK